MKSVMSHLFSQIPKVEIPRSVFDRSHGYKTTLDEAYLVPFYADEALPGDTFKAQTTIFMRMCTPIVPLMDNLFVDTFYFAVPIRLIWDNFKKFNGEQINPGDSTTFLVPQVPSGGTGFAVGELSDYLGLPTGIANINVSSLWHRAYNLIYNEWFRDENLINSAVVDKGDGPDTLSNYVLRKRGKRHDYFTSCLPWPQKGSGVTLPLGITAPVRGTSYGLSLYDGSQTFGLAQYDNGTGGVPNYSTAAYAAHTGDTLSTGGVTHFGKAIGVVTNENYSGLEADLSVATAATINSLRQAFQIQRLLERDARGGTRYTEIIRSHFGVVSPDARLQRPEYLGGSSQRISINPVQQTSSTDATTPQGNLAAFGVMSDGKGGFSKSFTEHCIILGIVNVRADLTYQQGLNRMFSRRTRFDFYWPALSHLGEQEVYNKEIYCHGDSHDNEIFGYQERYAEYRYFPSQITGKMRSTYATPLDIWHLSQKFTSLPTLNQTFIEEAPPISRIVAVPSEPHFKMDAFIQLHCARPMPVYSVPGLVDHF